MENQAKCIRTGFKYALPTIEGIQEASKNFASIVRTTPLEFNDYFSQKYDCNIYLKREDQQLVRSYKLRGAYNKISSLSSEQCKKGVVCYSAGNHAQGFAYSCAKMKVYGHIFMPTTTQSQKINRVKYFGQDYITIILEGDNIKDTYALASDFAEKNDKVVIPPFADKKIIEGQGTVALEVLEQMDDNIDYLIVPVGGGGLISGMSLWFSKYSPSTKIIGVEPKGAAALYKSLQVNKKVTLDKIDNFCDGAALDSIGEINYEVLKDKIGRVLVVPEGKICSTMIEVYEQLAIILEPAGALSISALDYEKNFQENIKGKNVVCIISGGNNDIARTSEIMERSMLYEGTKHYFIISFAQRPGAMREFTDLVLNKDDNIVRFEYQNKFNTETGPALVGIESKKQENIYLILKNLKKYNFNFEYLNENVDLMRMIL